VDSALPRGAGQAAKGEQKSLPPWVWGSPAPLPQPLALLLLHNLRGITVSKTWRLS